MVLPETLTVEKSEEIKKQKTFENLGQALNFAKRIKGQLYTEVDFGETASDGRDWGYVKGNKLVNRTGRWLVVKPTTIERKKLKRVM